MRDTAIVDVTALRCLVVNADDLGLHEDINRGVHVAHTKGIVTSASLVACGGAFDHAADVIRACPQLDVGVHLTLVEERPLSPPAEIPSLVGADGRFLPSYRHLAARMLTLGISSAEVKRELRRQIERLVALGRTPSHLDGHQHAHLLPPVWRLTLELAREYGIGWVRMPAFTSPFAARRSPADPVFRLALNVLSGWAMRSAQAPKRRARTPALHLSGALTEPALLDVLDTIGAGVTELVTHPALGTPALKERYGWNYEWSTELDALISPRILESVRDTGIRLTRFSEC